MSTEHVKALSRATVAAMFSVGELKKPGQEITIDGHLIRVEYFEVGRKCYDMLPTPTARYTIDGKRASRAAAYAIAHAA